MEKKKKPRDPLDRFYTPTWCVDQFIQEVRPVICPVAPSSILEPGTGRGDILRGLRRVYPGARITAIDLDPDAGPWPEADVSFEWDFLDVDWDYLWSGSDGVLKGVDLTVGNPPYAMALEFCEECLRWSHTLAFILRTDFLNSAVRSPFFIKHEPSHVFLLPNRPSYGRLEFPEIDGPEEFDYANPTRLIEDHKTGEYDYAWICWQSTKPKDQRTQLLWLPEVPVEIRRPK